MDTFHTRTYLEYLYGRLHRRIAIQRLLHVEFCTRRERLRANQVTSHSLSLSSTFTDLKWTWIRNWQPSLIVKGLSLRTDKSPVKSKSIFLSPDTKVILSTMTLRGSELSPVTTNGGVADIFRMSSVWYGLAVTGGTEASAASRRMQCVVGNEPHHILTSQQTNAKIINPKCKTMRKVHKRTDTQKKKKNHSALHITDDR